MRAWAVRIGVAILALVVAVVLAWAISPWPRVWVIGYFFDLGGTITAHKLARLVPPGVVTVGDLAYRPADPNDPRLDVFFPGAVAGTTWRLPTVVWVHGGGWIAGRRSDVANYARILAAHGFTTVAVGYALPPAAVYPVPVEEVNAALGYLTDHAGQLHIDPARLVLAGDSAGAQIAAQVADIVTNPEYARAMDITPAARPSQLAATVLACGVYDLARAGDRGGFIAKFFSAMLWAYSGRRDFRQDPRLRLMSVALHLTPRFPATFVTAGNGDPLVGQTREMARRLRGLGVPVDALLYPPGHRPRLPHEYQFNLAVPAGREALRRIVAFLKKRTTAP
jgi:acetyl esterase/lipase